tara:strand:+ start:991 stop:1683 length:693 start_codon:yes stop_codon:yes gene_type:complete
MKKNIWIVFFLFIFAFVVLFNKKLVEKYFTYKFSNWVEKKVIFDKFKFEYPNKISINSLKIKNSNPTYFDYIFEADQIDIDFDLKSFLFSELVIINSLTITKPSFFLELIEKKSNLNKSKAEEKNIIFEDNIGVAKKINENLPDKIWPTKKKDINFVILKSYLSNGTAFIRISSIADLSKIRLSNFEFGKTGNEEGYQHYKDVLRMMLFDIFAKVRNKDKKRILKEIYKF